MKTSEARPKPLGFDLVNVLRGHGDVVLRLTWAPDGKTLASTSVDRTIRLWDWKSGKLEKVLSGHREGVNEVAWGPDRAWLASASFDHTIRIWNLDTGQTVKELHGHTDDVSSISLSPNGRTMASASADRTVRFWRTDTWEQTKLLEGHKSNVYRVAWRPDGKWLASCSKDGSVVIWTADGSQVSRTKVQKSRPGSVAWSQNGVMLATSTFDGAIHIEGPGSRVLEGHTNLVRSAVFSFDDRVLASSSMDGTVRLWRTDTWEQVAQIDEPASGYWPQGIAFHPTEPILATFGEEDRVIRIWRLDIDGLLGLQPREQVHYRNAKVVLLGDTGVGKTGLRMVLTGEPFDREMRLPSTFGRRVFTFDSCEVEVEGRKETRETLLWDMAGQPAYRLVHQLHLSEVAVALAVFDARQAVGDPLGGIRHWARALRQARQREGGATAPLKSFLVVGRADVEGTPVSLERIEAVKREWGFDQFFETSAADGRGIRELAAAIRGAVVWNALPSVSSPKLFEKLKSFLIAEKATGTVIATAGDLFRSFQALHPEESRAPELRANFDACVGRLENRDLLRKLSFGGLILLQPELLDSYASAIVVASAGSGVLAEEDVLAGRFRMPGTERLADREQEKLLLIATVEELLRHQLVLREHSQEGTYLVFPGQFNRDWPDAPDPQGKHLTVKFEGPLQNIYATLAVRLAHSNAFRTSRASLWRNAAIFEADAGGECGLYLREFDDGGGELALFFRGQPLPSPETRFRFEAFVLSHLAKNALAGSITVQRLFSCDRCGNSVPQAYVELRRAANFTWFECPCGGKVSLLEPKERMEVERRAVQLMESDADRERDRRVSQLVIRGKEEIGEYDVFLCYNSRDKDEVLKISAGLIEKKVRPWLDVAALRAGDVWMESIAKVIAMVKCAVVFIGPSQAGRFEEVEIRALLRQCVDGGVRVIPAILPETEGEPQWSIFLRDFQRVDFRVAQPDPMSELLYGITGVRPEPS
ncbi:MAG: TIR domain-containing protein [Acidobacteriia bacterium]|nr:TIR domain-containing protein [Terriglobia bacterium]